MTGAPEDDGLGFSLKWNMGWMHDFTEYMKLDPLFRKGAHYQMTFSMEYATVRIISWCCPTMKWFI